MDSPLRITRHAEPPDDPNMNPSAVKVLHALTDYNDEFHQPFPGTVILPVADARQIDEDHQRHTNNNGLIPKSHIRVGDSGTIWGVPCIVAAVDDPMLAYPLED